MEIHGLGSIHGTQAIHGPHRLQATEAAAPTGNWFGVDELDISREADLISRAGDLPDIRADRVADIRAQIASGVYETDAKLEVALGRLLDEISG